MTQRRATQLDYEQRVLAAQRLLEQKLDDVVAPEDLAREANFSLHHFHRIFRAQLGESVMEHVRRLRLERAARRLRASDERILTVALEAGYESHEAFTRAFIERFGVAPSRFREEPSARVLDWKKRSPAPRASVSVQRFPSARVAFMRHRGGYQTISAFWARMYAWAEARGLLERSAPLYGVCPDDPEVTAEAQLRFDACVIITDDTPLDDAVAVSELPAGLYAVGLHEGSYECLADTYLDVIGHWFPQSGYELAPDAVIEHYLNDPSKVSAAELRTEVRVRIAE